MVKKSQTPAHGICLVCHGLRQGAWVVLTGRCGCARWVELRGAGLAVALIWELARMYFLTIREFRPQAGECFPRRVLALEFHEIVTEACHRCALRRRISCWTLQGENLC